MILRNREIYTGSSPELACQLILTLLSKKIKERGMIS